MEFSVEDETSSLMQQHNCRHENTYKAKTFDILNGFEIVAVRCLDCHKVVALTVKALKGCERRARDFVEELKQL